ncbi:MAG: histidinol dehydrogenase [Candidatus Micrarchaeota archaeon]
MFKKVKKWRIRRIWEGVYFTSWLVRDITDLSKLKNRTSVSVSDSVKLLINDMNQRGFDALADYSLKFDGITISQENIKIQKDEINLQASKLTENQIKAIDFAFNQTQEFQQEIAQNLQPIIKQTEFGSTKFIPKPIERIGIYVPGGLAPLPSSLLMAGTSARVAKSRELIVCTPPRKEGLNPAIAYLLQKLNITEAFWLGGVAAVWFMANGIPKISRSVDKICGPGNSYVTEAKSQLLQSGKVGIDMLAGPSEVLIIADKSANPEFIAADLLAQAEHGTNSSAILVTDSKELVVEVQKQLDLQLTQLKRKNEIKLALENCGAIFIVEDILDGVQIANDFAPEHLEIFCKKDTELAILSSGVAAGAIFIKTGESFADYGMTGGNHILPTNSTARFSSGLSVKDFVVWQYVEELTEQGQQKLSTLASCFADLESLEAHSSAARIRKR